MVHSSPTPNLNLSVSSTPYFYRLIKALRLTYTVLVILQKEEKYLYKKYEYHSCSQSIIMSVENKLSDFLSRSRDWERRPTNVPGIFLLKLPSSRSRQASVAIEINPVDATGAATKKRGQEKLKAASDLLLLQFFFELSFYFFHMLQGIPLSSWLFRMRL